MVIWYIVLIIIIFIILPIVYIGETDILLLYFFILPIIGIIMIVNSINSIIVNKNFERYNSNKNDISFKNNTEDLL